MSDPLVEQARSHRAKADELEARHWRSMGGAEPWDAIKAGLNANADPETAEAFEVLTGPRVADIEDLAYELACRGYDEATVRGWACQYVAKGFERAAAS